MKMLEEQAEELVNYSKIICVKFDCRFVFHIGCDNHIFVLLYSLNCAFFCKYFSANFTAY